MPQQSPVYFEDVESCVEDIIAMVGPRIVLGIPLGIGKPNPLVNALYRRVKADPQLQLKIVTAITVEVPKGSSDLEKRFLGPFVERVFGNYPDLEYAVDLRTGRIPSNVEVAEFFFKPGGFMNVPMQQQNYISTKLYPCRAGFDGKWHQCVGAAGGPARSRWRVAFQPGQQS